MDMELGSERNILAVRPKVVVGRDARISAPGAGRCVRHPQRNGLDVVDLGLSTTPTVELAVPGLQAQGGVILTASHNPKQWNALKLLDANGEFLSAEAGQRACFGQGRRDVRRGRLDGETTHDDSWLDRHVQHVLELALVDADLIRGANLTVAVDAVNWAALRCPLLEALGVSVVLCIANRRGISHTTPSLCPSTSPT